MCGCFLHVPLSWGPGLQPRHVPWLGIEPVTFWFAGQHSIHWATPTRASFMFFKHYLPPNYKSFRPQKTWICFWLCIFKLGLRPFWKWPIFVDKCVPFWNLRVNLPAGLRLKEKTVKKDRFSQGKRNEADRGMVVLGSSCIPRKSGSLRKRGASVFSWSEKNLIYLYFYFL